MFFELFFFLFLNINNLTFELIKTKTNSVTTVLSINNIYVPYIYVLIESIIQNANQKRPYEIFILTTNISLENKEILKNQIKKDNRFSIEFINVANLIKDKKINLFDYLSIETYFRFFIFDLFSDTQKILYLDSDLIINSDIADLYDINIEGKYLAAAKDIDIAGLIKYEKHKRKYIEKYIGYKGEDEYFQAGVILFNIQEIKKKFTTEIFFKVAEKRKWKWMDQDVLNYIFKGNVFYLNQKWNCIFNWKNLIKGKCRIDILKLAPKQLFNEYLQARKNPFIIHFAGNQKPWEYPDCDFSEYFWKYAKNSIVFNQIIKQNRKIIKRKIKKKLIKIFRTNLILFISIINLILYIFNLNINLSF